MHPSVVLETAYCAHNYHPLPVVIVKGLGAQVWDDQGKLYLDMMSAYSAVSHGHCHPRLVAALQRQSQQLNVISRAYYSDRLGPFLQRACELTRQDRALPMNSGAEAVETALKAARKWAYTKKGVPEHQAEIIVCHGNFHGRTITIVSFSTEAQYRNGFGPYTPGFKIIPYGDAAALEAAITPHTAAFLVEPVQGEGGIIVPPPGYLRQCADICNAHQVLFICDEVQTGLGRTGKLLACDHESVQPDGLILGKALGGGLLPVSMFLAKNEVMDVFTPGDHGSTFGGSALAAAVGLEALNTLVEENLVYQAAHLGEHFMAQLATLSHPALKAVRGKGLLIGLEFNRNIISARNVCEQLLKYGILSKETHETVVRLAPPLVVSRAQLDWAFAQIKALIQAIHV